MSTLKYLDYSVSIKHQLIINKLKGLIITFTPTPENQNISEDRQIDVFPKQNKKGIPAALFTANIEITFENNNVIIIKKGCSAINFDHFQESKEFLQLINQGIDKINTTIESNLKEELNHTYFLFTSDNKLINIFLYGSNQDILEYCQHHNPSFKLLNWNKTINNPSTLLTSMNGYSDFQLLTKQQFANLNSILPVSYFILPDTSTFTNKPSYYLFGNDAIQAYTTEQMPGLVSYIQQADDNTTSISFNQYDNTQNPITFLNAYKDFDSFHEIINEDHADFLLSIFFSPETK